MKHINKLLLISLILFTLCGCSKIRKCEFCGKTKTCKYYSIKISPSDKPTYRWQCDDCVQLGRSIGMYISEE